MNKNPELWYNILKVNRNKVYTGIKVQEAEYEKVITYRCHSQG